MNISHLPTFDSDESLLQHLQWRNYSNHLFVYGTGKSEKTPTFERITNNDYMNSYKQLQTVQTLPDIIGVLQKYYTSDGTDNNKMHKSQHVVNFFGQQTVNLNHKFFEAISNAVFANPQILESHDIVDEIVVAQNDVDNDSPK